MQDQILTVSQVAEILQVTPRTVRNLCIKGRFPDAYKFDPLAKRSDWKIPKNDLKAFLEFRRKIGLNQ